MEQQTTQIEETKRKPPRSEKQRVRFTSLPAPMQQMALDNLEFHRDAESVAQRFGVHQSSLIEGFMWRLHDRVSGRPKGPAPIIQLRRAA